MEEHSAEIILEELMAAISKQDYVENIKLQKNAVIDGKTSSHQIDLYWEFTDGDLTYKVLIDAHVLNVAATRSDIIEMSDIVREFYGLTTGVLFTRPVYDKDVKIMADNVGIVLCEMKQPLPEIWEPVIGNFKINADRDAIKKEKERLNITGELSINNADIKQLFLYNASHECIDTVGGVVANYLNASNPADFSAKTQSVTHTFKEPTFLQTGHEIMPFVKILGVSFDFRFTLFNEMTPEDKERENDELVRYILYNISRYVRE